MGETDDSLTRAYAEFQRRVPARRESFAGLEWRWREAGTGPGAVVLFPGAVGGADIFFVVFQRLARHGRVLAVDIPPTPDAGLALEGLDALLASRGITGATMLGASFSGLFVQAYARRFPSRVHALILSHTGAIDPARAARERRSAAIAQRLPLWSIRFLLKLVVLLLLRRSPYRPLWRRAYFSALDALTKADLISRYHLAASLELTPAGDWSGPVLVMHSSADAIAGPATQARLRAEYPDALFHEFPGAGHSAYSKDPAGYAEVVASFAEACQRG